MGFRIHPIFINDENNIMKNKFMELLKKNCNWNYCFITHSMLDNLLACYLDLDFYYLMEEQTITLDKIKYIKNTIKKLDTKFNENILNIVSAFINVSLELGIEWTIY
jgi:hypothetical protein